MSDALLGMSALLHALEPLANGLLDLDVVARARLNALAGKRLRLCPGTGAVDPAATSASITLAFGTDRFTLHAGDTQPVDLELSGPARALLHALRTGRADDEAFGVRAGGDTELLTAITATLRELSPDLLAPLRSIVGADATSALHTGGALALEVLRRAAAGAGPLLGSSATFLRDIGAMLRRRRSGD